MVVYKITNKHNNKCYVGITKRTIQERFGEHCENASMGAKYKLTNAIRKYGKDSFSIEIIEECETKEIAVLRETHWINTLNTYKEGYNMTLGGDGVSGANGWVAWNKGKPAWNRGLKMTNAPWNLGKTMSPETKAKVSAARKGKPWTEARRLAQENRAR